MSGGEGLRTARLVLRPLGPGDAEDLHGIWGDPRVIFWGASPSLQATRARLPALIARTQGLAWPAGWHLARERASGRVVGDVLLQPAPFLPGELEAGWHLRHDAWGRGYATEAAGALLAAAFEHLPSLRRVVCAILPSNAASERVARRLGFRWITGAVHGGFAHGVWERMRGAAPRSESAG